MAVRLDLLASDRWVFHPVFLHMVPVAFRDFRRCKAFMVHHTQARWDHIRLNWAVCHHMHLRSIAIRFHRAPLHRWADK